MECFTRRGRGSSSPWWTKPGCRTLSSSNRPLVNVGIFCSCSLSHPALPWTKYISSLHVHSSSIGGWYAWHRLFLRTRCHPSHHPVARRLTWLIRNPFSIDSIPDSSRHCIILSPPPQTVWNSFFSNHPSIVIVAPPAPPPEAKECHQHHDHRVRKDHRSSHHPKQPLATRILLGLSSHLSW